MTLTIDVHIEPADLADALRSDAYRGLTSNPKELPPKWFYDDRGSQLFDEITRLPEYYPTRTERAILASHSDEIARVTAADTLVELGSGTSEKTRLLLDALRSAGTLTRFVPFDVSETTLRDAAVAVGNEYPGVAVHAVAGDFERHLDRLPGGGRRLIAFLGGTIGNLLPDARARFLGEIAAGLGRDDAFLARNRPREGPGPARRRLRRRGGRHRGVQSQRAARAQPRAGRRLPPFAVRARRALRPRQRVDRDALAVDRRSGGERPAALDLVVAFRDGEEMRTEVSAKFRRDRVERELAAAGLRLTEWWTDPAGDFALSLSVLA